MHRLILLVICSCCLVSGCAHSRKAPKNTITTSEVAQGPLMEMDSSGCMIIDMVPGGIWSHKVLSIERFCKDELRGEVAVMMYGGGWQILEEGEVQGYSSGIDDFLVVCGKVHIDVEMDYRHDGRHWQLWFY